MQTHETSRNASQGEISTSANVPNHQPVHFSRTNEVKFMEHRSIEEMTMNSGIQLNIIYISGEHPDGKCRFGSISSLVYF